MEGGVEWRSPGASRGVTAPCKRKLLHWINSLPPPPCLLVERLADLRFGDVLAAVVAWLEGVSYDGQVGDARTAVAAAVDYVARQCCLVDDAMAHVVNGACCVARVLDGDENTIAVVVTGLKGVTELREQTRRDAAQRREAESRHAVASAIEAGDGGGGPSDSEQPRPWVGSVQLKSRRRGPDAATCKEKATGRSRQRAPVEATEATAAVAIQARHADRKAGGKTKTNAMHGRHAELRGSCDGGTETLRWMESFGVSRAILQISAESATEFDGSVFHDGVALCALAAVMAQRRGGVTIRHKLQTHLFGEDRTKVLFPRGATLTPRSAAEKRHNLSVAWGLLRECKALPRSRVMDCDAFVAAASAEGKDAQPNIWSILKALRDRTAQHTLTRVAPVASLIPLSEEKPLRRPYITMEQIETVKRWMKHMGVDPAEISSGILQDSLRNGVAICAVLNQAEKHAVQRIAYKDPPKTLHEVRDNIKKAIHAAAGLRAMPIPRAYRSVHAVEAVLLGDKQYVFGILWHVMQCMELANSPTAKTPPTHEVAHTEIKAIRQEPKSRDHPPPPATCSRQPTSTQPAVTLELDVPASALIEEEEMPSSTNSVSSVPWVEAHDHDDIFPVFERAPPRLCPIDGDIDMNDLQPRHSIPPPPQLQHVTLEVSEATKCLEHPEESISVAQKTESPCPRRRVTKDNTRDDHNAITATEKEPTRQSAAAIQFSHKQVERIRLWLQSTGVILQTPEDLHNEGAVLSEFSSGVLLCSIVEKLEHMRCMEGICRDEKLSRPKALHNIAKALNILEQKKVIPPQLARRRLDLYEGKRATILLLLSAMRKAYGHRSTAQATVITSKKRELVRS